MSLTLPGRSLKPGIWHLQRNKYLQFQPGLNVALLIIRTCIGLLLCSLSLTALAAQPESHRGGLFSIQLTHTDTSQQSWHRIDTMMASTTPNNPMFNKTSRLPAFSGLKKRTLWITSIRWHFTTDGNHAALSPQLLLESTGSRIEIRPLQHSAWITWRRALP